MEATSKGIIVKDFLRRFPSYESTKLAKLLGEQYPTEFTDVELTRGIIRYYRGANGTKMRSSLTDETYIPKVNIPVSDKKDWTPFIIPESDGPILAGGDAHIPYHDQDALEIFIERGVEMKAGTVLLAGDWLDCYQVSRWQKDPRKRNIKEELDIFKEVFGIMRKAMPWAKWIFKFGNHEDRFDHYVMANAPELFDLPEVHLESILDLPKDVSIVKDNRVMRFGHLNLIHGHEYVFAISNPVNPARGLYNRAKKSTVCFHHHRSSSHSEATITGDSVTCWSVGSMCDLHPEYLPLNSWNIGFAEIYPEGEGMFRVANRQIMNYRLI